MVIPAGKDELVVRTRDRVREYEQQYMDGVITQGEKYNKVIDEWSHCSDAVADALMVELSSTVGSGSSRHPQLDLHDGSFRSAWRTGPDQAARRHARA